MKGKTGKEGKNVVTKGKQQHGQGRAKKPTQGATKNELLTHRITDTKTNPQKKPFIIIRSYALAKENEQTLADVKQDATDALGRAISSSAVLRACLRFLGQQKSSWVAKQLHPLIEVEIEQGIVWGKKRKP